jgi:predicted DNA-binding transcriptional regulator AlpA
MIIARQWYTSKEIQILTGKSRPTIDRWEAAGLMPRGLRPNKRTIGYPKDKIDAWLRGEWQPSGQGEA